MARVRSLLACLDLTRLDEDDPPERIAALVAAAATPFGAPAAICVYPEYVLLVREALARHRLAAVAVASVANFPDGGSDAERVAREVRRAIAAGADEVDVVFPWSALLAGDAETGARVVRAARAAAGSRARLKLILESGALGGEAEIRDAARLAIDGGADFLKTSTGKRAGGATPAAARAMLETIRERRAVCGLKVSGGVRTVEDALAYQALADEVMGRGWATPERFRIGASALLDDILRELGHAIGPVADGY